ncbi:TPA: hypothetical protein I7730_15695 [Vibrio vulnificus]|uniref:Uncharacterized protein n=1 Tax=Vibrio vulnificus TaxID=672 RepID=A0A8H9TGL5_VIBVL|nr:hypothetical protein [Vibrio vulnificus]HAS8541225.1 hypothetical protein [Vibrio vulnificus]
MRNTKISFIGNLIAIHNQDKSFDIHKCYDSMVAVINGTAFKMEGAQLNTFYTTRIATPEEIEGSFLKEEIDITKVEYCLKSFLDKHYSLIRLYTLDDKQSIDMGRHILRQQEKLSEFWPGTAETFAQLYDVHSYLNTYEEISNIGVNEGIEALIDELEKPEYNIDRSLTKIADSTKTMIAEKLNLDSLDHTFIIKSLKTSTDLKALLSIILRLPTSMKKAQDVRRELYSKAWSEEHRRVFEQDKEIVLQAIYKRAGF